MTRCDAEECNARHCEHWFRGDPCCACGDEPRDPTDFTDYDGPRGREAADELAWRQEAARRLK